MFIQSLLNGISIGSVYALIAIGYNMVYGILELLNFAHGDVYVIGCFVVFSLLAIGVNPIVAILAGIVVGFILNIAVERFAYRPVRYSGRITPVISAVGIAYIMRNIVQKIWGPETFLFNLGIKTTSFQVFGAVLGSLQIYILFIAISLMLVTRFLLKYSKIGQAVMAICQSIPTAMLMGIPVNRLISLVYGIGAALGVVGGVLFCMYFKSIFMGIGFMMGTVKAWMASIVGGVGSMLGAVIAAIMIGLVESYVAAYLTTTYKNAIVWGALIVFLLIKPQGLFPAQIAEKI